MTMIGFPSRLAAVVSACCAAASLSACATPDAPKGTYKVGQPYQINGKWYHPAENPGYDEVGVASWYGRKFHGLTTANGERFNMHAMTAAHPTLPMPSIVRVTNLDNKKSVVLRVNDRGPFVGGRIIDLSMAAADKLEFKNKGTTKVRVQYLGPADINGRPPVVAARDASDAARLVASVAPRDPVAQLPAADLSPLPAPSIKPQPSLQTSSSGVAAPTALSQIRVPPPVASTGPQPLGAPAPALAAAPRQTAGAGTASPRPVVAVPPATPAPPRSLTAPTPVGHTPAAPEPSISVAGHFIQAAAFSSAENAEKARRSLAGAGEASVSPAAVGGRTYYRVRVGPFVSYAEAEARLPTVRAAGFSDARIVTSRP